MARVDCAAGSPSFNSPGVLYFDVDLDERVLGSALSALLWISAEPSALTAAGTAIAAHPEAPWVGATTGPTNLLASVVCADTGHLYRYLTTQIAALSGVRRSGLRPGPFRLPGLLRGLLSGLDGRGASQVL